MKLHLPRAFLMPERCACCLGHADAYLEASLTKTVFLIIVSIRRTARVRIPYCRECCAHISDVAGWRILLETFLIWILSCFASVGLLSLTSWLKAYPSMASVGSLLNAVAVLLPWMLAFGYCVRKLMRRGRSPGPGHIRRGVAVELADFSDEMLVLECRNPKFRALVDELQSLPSVVETVVEAFESTRPAPPSVIGAAAPSPTVVPPTSAPPPPASASPAPPPMELSNDSVRRRLAEIPRDAKPEQVLRFVAFKCKFGTDGVTATFPNRAVRTLAWSDVASLYMRRLPHDPPWERMLVMDLTPRHGPPIRILPTTFVNFRDLPGGAASSHHENCRRLAAHLVEQNPDVILDPETRSFVTGFGPCAALPGIEQFLRYDDQFLEAFG